MSARNAARRYADRHCRRSTRRSMKQRAASQPKVRMRRAAASCRRPPPGYTRRPLRNGFAYYGPDGVRVRDADEIARINALAIPPAYTDVWICMDPRGHLQATGRDARGRKQYRYHPGRATRDANKYARMAAFARSRVRAHPRARHARSGVAGHAARQGRGDDRPLARHDAREDRQRGIRTRKRLVRADDVAQASFENSARRCGCASPARAGSNTT